MLGPALAAGLGLPEPVRVPRPRTARAGLRSVDFPPGRRGGVRAALAAARAVPGAARVQLEIPPGARGSPGGLPGPQPEGCAKFP
ncbi:hypothetical protein ACFVFI_07155 [Streptomyces sp. NPDC057705]|uniref:hypothetical protein n=1 Tax=Streptomyces sp. NPDC057705 TaxID=3346222 RepID=UPI0036B76D54